MTIYTVEVGGRPVAAMNSDSLGHAEDCLLSNAFTTGLTVYEMEGGEPGKSIWDGEEDIFVREALPDESATWEKMRAKAIREGDADPDDENFVTFLGGVREVD